MHAMSGVICRHRWTLSVFVLFAVLLGTWVVGVPRYAAPDEPAHTVKAYGTARGETIGEPIEGFSPLTRAFQAPLTLASGDPGCFAFYADIPASCAMPDGDMTVGDISTTAGTYPPWYYLVVGGVTRATGQDTSVRAYRTVTALGSAALLAVAFLVAARLGRGRPALLLLALTPMAVFLFPTVNPTAWEISATLLLWVQLAWLCLRRTVATRRDLLAVSTIGAAIILIRPIALPWIAIAFVSYLAMERRPLAADRRATLRLLGVASAPLAVAVAAGAAWSKYAGVALTDDKFVRDASSITVFRAGFGRTNWLFHQAVGVLGWVDTSIPTAAVTLVVVGFAFTLAMILFTASLRVRWLTTAFVVVWVMYPTVYVTLTKTPEVWQGRYNLPLLGGLVFCALLCAATRVGEGPAQRLATYLAAAFVVIEPLAFHQMLRRFMVGSRGDILLRYRAWWPSINAWALIALNVAAAAGIAVLARRSPPPVEPVTAPGPR